MKRLFKSIVVLGVLLVSKTISQVISSTTTTKTSTFAATPTPTPTPSPQTPLLRISSLSVTDENGAGVSALSGNSIASTIRQPQIANQNCSQQTSKTANPLQIGKNSMLQFGGSSLFKGNETIEVKAYYSSNPRLTITPIQLPVNCRTSTEPFCQTIDATSNKSSDGSWTSKFLKLGILQATTNPLSITIQFKTTQSENKAIAYYSCADLQVSTISTAIRVDISKLVYALASTTLFSVALL